MADGTIGVQIFAIICWRRRASSASCFPPVACLIRAITFELVRPGQIVQPNFATWRPKLIFRYEFGRHRVERADHDLSLIRPERLPQLGQNDRPLKVATCEVDRNAERGQIANVVKADPLDCRQSVQ